MKKIYSYIILSIIIITAFWSCETDITVDLPRPESQIIVEASIENDAPAKVFLTRNQGYFDPVSIPEIDENTDFEQFVKFLEEGVGLIYDTSISITVYEIGNPANAEELNQTIDITTFPYFGYSTSSLKGEAGSAYRLEINYNDTAYYAETSIPQPVDIDSVWYTSDRTDSLGFLHFLFEDPRATRNFYKISLLTVGEQLSYSPPYFGSEFFDDEGFEGDTFRYSPLTKGFESNDFFSQEIEGDEEFNNAIFHKFNSEVSLKLSAIDKQSFVFWMSYVKHLGTAGNPFTNPTILQSNIQGGNAGGYFTGYGSYTLDFTIDSTLIRK